LSFSSFQNRDRLLAFADPMKPADPSNTDLLNSSFSSNGELNEMFVTLANALPLIVWIAEADGNVTFCNDRVQEFAGAEKRSDGSWSWKGLLHDADR
jgi:PAS domain-containing protein